MKIEIWSDVACPFCYIGKRHLEKAIEDFEHPEEVNIKWHSFELDPEAETETDQDIYEKLASKYGQSVEWAKQANDDMKQKAEEVGIDYNPEKIIPTNTFDAHQLIKLADTQGLADDAEERLFKAYFTEGKNVSDLDTLLELGREIGLDPQDVKETLQENRFEDEVRSDEQEAQKIGVRGVPFFVLNRKFAVSGAQPVHTFLEALQKAHTDEQEESVNQA